VSGPGLPSERSERGEVSPAPSSAARGGAAAGQPLSVLKYEHKSTREHGRWTMQQRRIYRRAQTCLLRWSSCGYRIRWVMLSSSDRSDPSRMAMNHARLLRRIGRAFGYRAVHYFVVQTAEGENVAPEHRGVLHALWAWEVPSGWSGKQFYVPQEWLSRQWEELHGARYVWVSAYKSEAGRHGGIANYLVTQYLQGQNALVRFFWSWRLTFGGLPIESLWRAFVREFWRRGLGGRSGCLQNWRSFVGGHSVSLGRWMFDLGGLQAGQVVDVDAMRLVPVPSVLRRRLGLGPSRA
jgi:hypothetical protein